MKSQFQQMKQTILVKENAATAYLLLALAISIDGDYEKAFESYEQSISLYNKVYRTEPLSVVGYLALAHRYYGLALEDSDIVKALEHYITAIDYYIEYDEDVSEINEVISELSGVISMLPEDVNQNIINLTYVLINKCKQLDKNVDMESLERMETYLQFYKKSN